MKCLNPSEMIWSGTIQEKGTVTVVNGQKDFTWTNKYTGVKAKRLEIKARGVEEEDERQPKAETPDSWLIWKLSGITEEMRYLVDGEIYHIKSIRPYRGGRKMIILDTIRKDNDGVGMFNPDANLEGELEQTLIG